jgi:RNA polymerase subunit RPABC4/transcription elongation factor Spt4
MKVCTKCNRVVNDKEEKCPECGNTEFQALLFRENE